MTAPLPDTIAHLRKYLNKMNGEAGALVIDRDDLETLLDAADQIEALTNERDDLQADLSDIKQVLVAAGIPTAHEMEENGTTEYICKTTYEMVEAVMIERDDAETQCASAERELNDLDLTTTKEIDRLKAALAARCVALPQRWKADTRMSGAVVLEKDRNGEWIQIDDVLAALTAAGVEHD